MPQATLPQVIGLPLDAQDLRYVQEAFGIEGNEAQALSLARALAASPWWRGLEGVVLVVRPSPEPLLGFVGPFDEASRARIESLHWQLKHTLPRLRYVSYAQAEEGCERLAEGLLETFGREELRRFRFTAIPRGGFIVLGMLAYALGLKHAQLEPANDERAPLIVVDDCALSGVRFGHFLQAHPNQPVVFAHLYSHPSLRAAILAREARVLACLGAYDLHDYAEEERGDDYPAWKARWSERMDPRGYWVGQPEHVCFAWNEPDISIWNPVTEKQEGGWQLVPPELCLKNRPGLAEPPVQVQVQVEGKGPLKPPAGVIFAKLEEQTVVGNLTSAESISLRDVAADMWQAVVEQGSEEAAARTLAEEYEVEETTVRADLEDLVAELLVQGFLAREAALER